MKQLFTLVVTFCIVINTKAQNQEKGGLYLSFNYNKTLNDYTIGNNPSGIGLGLQKFIYIKPKLRLTIAYTGFLYLENDKVLRLNNDTSNAEDVRSMSNLLAGLVYYPTKRTMLSFESGLALINGHVYLTVKPSFGFFLSQSQRWLFKLAYLNVVNRTQPAKENFTSVNFSVGLKL